MRFSIVLSCAALVLSLCGSGSSNYMGAAGTVLKLGWTLLNTNKNFLQDKVSIHSMIRDVSSQINRVERALKTSEAVIISEVSRLINYHQMMHDLTTSVYYINNMYDRFQKYSDSSTYQDATVRNFAQDCISHGSHQLPNTLNFIHRLVTPALGGNIGLFELLIENRRTKDDAAKVCNSTISLQQEVYLLYNTVGISLVKGYVMQSYAYEILKNLGAGQYVTEIESTKMDYKIVMSDIGQSARSVMSIASRDIRPCDAKIHKQGETYEQLEWLFNQIVVNEIFLNSRNSCWNKCKDYKNTLFYHSNPIPGIHTCPGKIYDCFYQSLIHYCPATQPHRRYNGFDHVTVVFGKDTPAMGDVNCTNQHMISRDPYTGVQGRWFTDCDDCICYCGDSSHAGTVRTFSLRAVQSDIFNNMIVTGIRFVKKNRMFYIQVQEGKLKANGKVESSTIKWQPIEEFDYNNPSISADDYFTIKYDKRGINLDTVAAPSGQVLTGIKLSNRGSHLALEIKASPFNYTTGAITTDDDRWISSTVNYREEIVMDAPHIPTLAIDENVVNTRENGYLMFRQSDWPKDVGQTPVPFIDIQPVVADPPLALSGAGMFFKGQPGYGGFIGLKLVSYDYREFIGTEINTDES